MNNNHATCKTRIITVKGEYYVENKGSTPGIGAP
jgi:hypothetical protein